MIIEEKEIILKNGQKAVLRSPKEEDINSLIDYLRITAVETEYILRYPEECDKYTYEKEKEIIDRMNTSPDEALILCIVDGKVVGNCGVTFQTWIKTRHRGNIGIAIIKEYWNQGIGTKLFEEIINIAQNKEYVTQLELDFIEGNCRARALYEKMGFKICAIEPNAIRFKNGTYLNEYKMIKYLDK